MRILLLSDLHFGKKAWGSFAQDQVEWAKKKGSCDVLIFCGDLAESPEDLHNGLDALRGIDAKHRLFVAGNNDVERLEKMGGKVSNYANDFQDLIGEDFHLLDRSPKKIDGVNFVGNMLSFNGSLWRSNMNNPSTNVVEQVKNTWEKAEKYWGGNPYNDISFPAFNQNLVKRLHSDVGTDGSSSIVITHFVPHPDFVVYGHSEKFDYLNFFMGRNMTDHYPNVRMGFCGHTHRRKSVYIGKTWVENVSGPILNPVEPVRYQLGL